MKKVTTLLFCLGVVFCLVAQDFTDSIRAFPGAEGFGAYVTGGRGGRVHYVMHTDDMTNKNLSAYKTSFRAALEDTGTDPLTVVFMCGGVINLAGEISCSRSNLTIAGQTALGDGICIKGYCVKFSGQNVIIRHIRFRPGDVTHSNESAIRFKNGGNFIIDHCTFSWSMEENMTVYDNNYSTIQWCMLTESLYISDHSKGARAYAAQWGGQTSSYHHNLLAHHQTRMPRQNGNTSNDHKLLWDYRNNVHYNWGATNALHGGGIEEFGGESNSNLINNYYVPGPASPAQSSWYFCAPSGGRPAVTGNGNEYLYGYGKWWLTGNVMKGDPAKTTSNFSGLSGSNQHYAGSEFIIPEPYRVDMTSADTAYKYVLLGAGATLPLRDSLDRRVVREVETQTYTFKGKKGNGGKLGIIDSQDDLMPEGETAATWNPWYSHYRTVTLKTVPKGQVNEDIFLVEKFIDRDKLIPNRVSTDTVKIRKVVDTDKDGMPDWWEKANGLDLNDASDRNKRAATGYTMLEVYLNSFPHEDAPADNTDDEGGDDDETSVRLVGDEPHLRVYPNPVVSGYFSIETVLEPVRVDLYNTSGTRVASFTANGQNTFSITPLSRGSYFVRVIFANGKVSTRRIVK